jgi:hypothetical protein
VHRIFEHVDHLESHPRLGSKPEELKAGVTARSSKLTGTGVIRWNSLAAATCNKG